MVDPSCPLTVKKLSVMEVSCASLTPTEVEVLDIDITTDADEIKAAVRKHFGEETSGEIMVSLTTRLVRTGHLKMGWVACRVRKKTEVLRCYRCQGFGHMAASCEGPDRAGAAEGLRNAKARRSATSGRK